MRTYKFILILFMPLIVIISCKKSSIEINSRSEAKKILNNVLKQPVRHLNNYSIDWHSNIISRIISAPDFIIQYLNELDNKNYYSYRVSKNDLKLIQRSIKFMPELHKKIMRERVVGIYFIKDFLGSGMADWIIDKNNNLYAFLVFNPITLKMNIEEWLTYKEKTCFSNGNSNIDIIIKAGKSYSAFLGILLHETTHVIDYIKNITPYVERNTYALSIISNRKINYGSFVTNIWKDIHHPVDTYDYSFRKDVTFYGFSGGPKIDRQNAFQLYSQFANCPFVSIYGSQSWAEDLAEFVTFYHLTQILKQPYTILIQKNKKNIFSIEPMESDKVKSRFSLMKQFYK